LGVEGEPGEEGTGLRLEEEPPVAYAAGDQAFLNELPPELEPIGQALLRGVRRHYAGELQRGKSGIYVESPDKFWAVRIQPRDKSLRIIVRGTLKDFNIPPGIELKPDRRSYSNFKIWKRDQIDGALSIIRSARKR
jgi:hypothetical protein